MSVHIMDKLAEDMYPVENVGLEGEKQTTSEYVNLISLVIKKAKNQREYKKYVDMLGMLTLAYYKHLGSIEHATNVVYSIFENANGVADVKAHYDALMKSEKEGQSDHEQARSKISSTLLNDYSKRFGNEKAESYNVLVLQSWISKVENVNELAILLENIINTRDKIGNSWDYEVHVVPILLEKAFDAEALADYATSTTNFIAGMGKRLKDNYLAVMTAVKILEMGDSPKVMKKYIRDMIKEDSKRIDQLNMELAVINSGHLSKLRNIVKAAELKRELYSLTKQVDELMNGIDPKELMLESTKR